MAGAFMSLSDLASLGSFVSALAVLISLVFLYFQLRQLGEQVRQTERNQRATILQVRANRTAERTLRVTDPAVADAYMNATRCTEDLTATQLQQFTGFARAVFADAEDVFNQHRDGLVGDHDFEAFLAYFRQSLASQGHRTIWRLLLREASGPAFAAFVDSVISETRIHPAASSTDMLAAWRAEFAAAAGSS